MTERWEYRVEEIPSRQARVEGMLNVLGQDGWDLVSVIDSSKFVFKRPLAFGETTEFPKKKGTW